MAAGALAGSNGPHVPAVEPGVTASLILLGLALTTGARLPTLPAAGAVAGFGLVHGYAHGHAAPGSSLLYPAGLLLSTAALHVSGIALAGLLLKHRRDLVLRLAGGLTAASAGVL